MNNNANFVYKKDPDRVLIQGPPGHKANMLTITPIDTYWITRAYCSYVVICLTEHILSYQEWLPLGKYIQQYWSEVPYYFGVIHSVIATVSWFPNVLAYGVPLSKQAGVMLLGN